jgi:hypothetical protein
MGVQAIRSGSGQSSGAKFLKSMLLTGVPFGLFMGIFWSILNGWKSGVFMGVFTGVLFGIVMSAFAAYQKKKFQRERPLAPDENLVKEGGANHYKKIEAVGGWMYLTNKGLIFRPHSINIQREELSIPLQEISEAKPCMTFGIIPNGLEIKTIDGKTEKFVVEDRKDWAEKILETKELTARLSQ